MSERLIFHCDCNNFFASCECLERPELRNVPMAVAGDPEERVGVVVAKNELAKKAGVRTTDTVWQAKKKCPGIVFVPPRHHYYREISDQVNLIYRDYSDYVEPASIDESYLDLTGTLDYYHMSARELADTIRERVRREIGITISVGVANNKVFAKMGSDYKKPDATTVILGENYKEILWPLPVSDLMFAGKASVRLLNQKGIRTVGDLALQPRERVVSLLGKGGETLWAYANGLDTEPVRKWGDKPEVKSVSHGMTFRRDLYTEDEFLTGVAVQADRIAMSLRRQGLKGSVVSVQIKTPELAVISRQVSLDHYTWLEHEIRNVAMRLIRENWRAGLPIRALTVGVTKLVPAEEAAEQTDLFDLLGEKKDTGKAREKQDKMEAAVDGLRQKLGNMAVTLGVQQNEDIGVRREWKKKNS
ncbi:MAG: DNA polymerase IV [Clostridia bacterium]|nr:DNA polymerase IV [Clostridia bacterium]